MKQLLVAVDVAGDDKDDGVGEVGGPDGDYSVVGPDGDGGSWIGMIVEAKRRMKVLSRVGMTKVRTARRTIGAKATAREGNVQSVTFWSTPGSSPWFCPSGTSLYTRTACAPGLQTRRQ